MRTQPANNTVTIKYTFEDTGDRDADKRSDRDEAMQMPVATSVTIIGPTNGGGIEKIGAAQYHFELNADLDAGQVFSIYAPGSTETIVGTVTIRNAP